MPRPKARPKVTPSPGLRLRKGRLPPTDLLDDDEEELLDEEVPGEEVDSDEQLEDNAEVDEAEEGITDLDNGDANHEPSTVPSDELDTEELHPGSILSPAITFFSGPHGCVGYLLTEFASPDNWERLDGLARFLLQQAPARTLAGLLDMRKCHRIKQTDLIKFLGGEKQHEEVRISELVQRTTLNMDGNYIPAATFFRENTQRTYRGRERARELLEQGIDPKSAARNLEKEFKAKRTTVLGWLKTARKETKP